METYNVIASLQNWTKYTFVSNTITANCTVVGVLGATYGKYESDSSGSTMIMEYGNFLPFLLSQLPATSNNDFKNFINATNPYLLESYADFFVYTLPAPRYNYYTSKNYEGIQDKVTKETNQMIAALGFY